MSVYMTEAEQVELIKSWWKRYNGIITVCLSLVLLVVAGFKYWHWHQEKVVEQASNAYEHLMLAFSNQDTKSVRSYSNQLVTDYGDTVYADAARLTLAKLDVANEKYKRARETLEYVAAHSKMKVFADVARIRLARLLIEEKAYDNALSELDKVINTAYFPVVNELRGDIYSVTGRYQQAVTHYRKAMNEVQKNGMGNLFLEMKSNELLALTKSTQVLG
ncbi:MAG: tetratricopeptide repeat protein [Legionellaceae bacterium]|nr:tetratricopeptide repeat protein [Legionellaceae bacterium]